MLVKRTTDPFTRTILTVFTHRGLVLVIYRHNPNRIEMHVHDHKLRFMRQLVSGYMYAVDQESMRNRAVEMLDNNACTYCLYVGNDAQHHPRDCTWSVRRTKHTIDDYHYLIDVIHNRAYSIPRDAIAYYMGLRVEYRRMVAGHWKRMMYAKPLAANVQRVIIDMLLQLHKWDTTELFV